MTKFQILLASALTALAGAASAQAAGQSYVGASIGLQNKYSIDCLTGVACDKTGSFGGKVYGGYNIDQFAIEGMAFTTGRAKGSLVQNGSLVAGEVRNMGLGVYGVLPLTVDNFTFKGKLGLAYVNSKASYTAGGSQSKSSFTPIVGAGVSYAINKQWSINGDWDQIRGKYSSDGKARVNMLSAGLSYKF
nr:outer membrane beta-barrel protein [uncultured Roseateles sp.]